MQKLFLSLMYFAYHFFPFYLVSKFRNHSAESRRFMTALLVSDISSNITQGCRMPLFYFLSFFILFIYLFFKYFILIEFYF